MREIFYRQGDNTHPCLRERVYRQGDNTHPCLREIFYLQGDNTQPCLTSPYALFKKIKRKKETEITIIIFLQYGVCLFILIRNNGCFATAVTMQCKSKDV